MNYHNLLDFFYLRNRYIFYISLCFLFACQSNLRQASDVHEISFNQWHNLADYAYEHFNEKDIYFLAKVNKNQYGDYFLDKIRLSNSPIDGYIDLLRPSFSTTSVCSPYCQPLNELTVSSNGLNTILGELSKKYQHELFDFYTNLILLNPIIKDIKNTSPEKYSKYLSWLYNQKATFNNFKEFQIYINKSLSKQNFLVFLKSPEKYYSNILTIPTSDTSSWLEFETSPNETPESTKWLTTPTRDELAFLKLMEMDTKEQLPLVENPKNKKVIDIADLDIGDTVCRPADNSFGVVSDIIGQNYTVQLVGQLFYLIDGQPHKASPGEIIQPSKPFIYLPLETKVAGNSDIFTQCQISQDVSKIR